MCTQNLCFDQNEEKYHNCSSENCHFDSYQKRIILNRGVNVMINTLQACPYTHLSYIFFPLLLPFLLSPCSLCEIFLCYLKFSFLPIYFRRTTNIAMFYSLHLDEKASVAHLSCITRKHLSSGFPTRSYTDRGV